MKYLTLLVLLPVVLRAAEPSVQTASIEYQHGENLLEGYVAFNPDLKQKRPGVLIVHEWKGLGVYAQRRAQQLAALGYVAFAADMYGKGIRATTHEEAARLSGIYRNDRQLMRARARAALETLRDHPQVDPRRIAAIGYCFGGTTVLELARGGSELRGVVSFHGGLGTPLPARPQSIRARIQVHHGDADRFISPEELNTFREEMRVAQADWQLIVHGGAVHGFTVKEAGTDPSSNIAYHEVADHRSWRMMLEFFREVFE